MSLRAPEHSTPCDRNPGEMQPDVNPDLALKMMNIPHRAGFFLLPNSRAFSRCESRAYWAVRTTLTSLHNERTGTMT